MNTSNCLLASCLRSSVDVNISKKTHRKKDTFNFPWFMLSGFLHGEKVRTAPLIDQRAHMFDVTMQSEDQMWNLSQKAAIWLRWSLHGYTGKLFNDTTWSTHYWGYNKAEVTLESRWEFRNSDIMVGMLWPGLMEGFSRFTHTDVSMLKVRHDLKNGRKVRSKHQQICILK